MTNQDAVSPGPAEEAGGRAETVPGSAMAGGCRGSASATPSCGCCPARIWRRCRALGVTAATLTGWQAALLAAGEASLATRPAEGEEIESGRLKAWLGDMRLEHELLEARIAILEGKRPLARPWSRG